MNWKSILAAHIVAAIAAAVVLTAPEPAEALPSKEMWRTYYNNANYDEEVGELYVTSCAGVVNEMTWGVKSRYSISHSESCSGTGTSGTKCYVNGVLTLCPSDLCDSSLFSCN